MAKIYQKSNYLRFRTFTALLLIAVLGLFLLLVGDLGRYVSNYQSQSVWLLAIAAIIVIAYPILKIFQISFIKFDVGFNAERLIKNQLKKLPKEYAVFRNLHLPGTGDIDFVVVGPTGIFAVEVKSQRHYIAEKLPQFIKQTKFEATELKNYLKVSWVSGMLIFSRSYMRPQVIESIDVLSLVDLNRAILSHRPDFFVNQQEIVKKLIAE